MVKIYYSLITFIVLLFGLFVLLVGSLRKEGFDNNTQINTEYTLNMPIIPFPKNSLINYNNLNSPQYSHTVNLSINDPITCKNFCGPKSQCLLTRNQCTSDIDCPGCLLQSKKMPTQPRTNIDPYEASGKIGQQGLTYSSYINSFNGHKFDQEEAFPGSINNKIIRPYQGIDRWESTFNEGLKIYNKKMGSYLGQPEYPMTETTTGLFYNTTPPASNI
jgi:hypothetical protein